jgi:hypothetical protein
MSQFYSLADETGCTMDVPFGYATGVDCDKSKLANSKALDSSMCSICISSDPNLGNQFAQAKAASKTRLMQSKDKLMAALLSPSGAGYYAAFVRDLDGYRLEAVCHKG